MTGSMSSDKEDIADTALQKWAMERKQLASDNLVR